MIVVVASEKGGTGKTTIATNLAIMRSRDRFDVLLIDADTQGSSQDFAAVRSQECHQPEIVCSSIFGRGITSELRKLTSRFDTIIVDVGGRDSVTMRGALLMADFVLVPFLPSQLDVWSVEKMDILIGEVLSFNEGLQAFAFLNKVDSNPKMGLTPEAANFAKDFKNLRLLDVKIAYRVAYRRAVAEGMSVTEIEKKDKKANEEIYNLYSEVFKNAKETTTLKPKG